ncbi:hypothetical protein IQ226_04540 [Dolichospermum sp. LEGE 00240]|uniref:hypothetical protein n=1 Tax=Dolichospermum sp. LEGE 00240 TaxID=1828603 RepID=UPI001880CE26|nr:hypothetical protein [Dolichospermum sp. LEGE 00240]MBE9248472.1 hypothetical protein [Dolichospermum sp. LEGE 00240]
MRSLLGMWGAIAFRDVGSAIAISGMLGSAIAKRSVGIAFWGCVGVRKRCAAASSSLFWDVEGCDRCFGVWECVSVALLQVVCFLWV